MPSSLIARFGTEESPAETTVLTAGPLTVELDAGNLRYARYEGREAIRAVSYVVRDQYWGTFNPDIANFKVEESGGGFTVTYDAICRDAKQRFRYAARIVGAPDGALTFEARGTAETDFLTNRTGFVVLHPVAVSGRPVQVLHVNGRTVETTFPELIDPKQPIMDIRALTHEVRPGLRVTCTMEGDAFEMEDQRNWTDASYKTYVRPLALPFPYTIEAGEAIEQAVRLTFAESAPGGRVAGRAKKAADTVSVKVGTPSGAVPRFGMAIEPQHAKATLSHGEVLSKLEPAFVSGFLPAGLARRAETLGLFKQVADRFGAELGLEIVVPDDAAPRDWLGAVAKDLRDVGATAATVAVTKAGDMGFVMPGTEFPDTKEFDELYASARAAFPATRLGGGTFVYFTELNRKLPPFAALDFVCHGTCAIVHAADDRSVTESIEALPYVVKSCRALFGDRPYRVAPAGIGSRTSPFGNEPPPNPNSGRITMTRADPRQRGLLGAAWHLGYAARMAEGGVDSVVLGAPVGEFGLVYRRMDHAQPWYDDHGGLYPAYHAMRGVYRASGRARLATDVSDPREVQALALSGADGTELWLANLSGDARKVVIVGIDGNGLRVAGLDESGFRESAGDPDFLDRNEATQQGAEVELAPYAVARLRPRD